MALRASRAHHVSPSPRTLPLRRAPGAIPDPTQLRISADRATRSPDDAVARVPPSFIVAPNASEKYRNRGAGRQRSDVARRHRALAGRGICEGRLPRWGGARGRQPAGLIDYRPRRENQAAFVSVGWGCLLGPAALVLKSEPRAPRAACVAIAERSRLAHQTSREDLKTIRRRRARAAPMRAVQRRLAVWQSQFRRRPLRRTGRCRGQAKKRRRLA